jgi:2-C-methyl-D-erythritol 4-phosphate cytidylyltransferase
MEKNKISAIILAGGKGERFGKELKQFLVIQGKPLIFFSLEAFIKCRIVEEIIVAVPKKYLASARKIIHTEFDSQRVKVISGGKTRGESSFKALDYIAKKPSKPSLVVFHDAVRPLITRSMIRAVIREATRSGAASLGVNSVETIGQVENSDIVSVPNREMLCETHTPHCFRFDWIWQAHLHKKDNKESSDLVLLVNMGRKIKIVGNFYPNMKLTHKVDLIAINSYLEELKNGRKKTSK